MKTKRIKQPNVYQRSKIEKIIRNLVNSVYKNDAEMNEAKERIIGLMWASDLFTEENARQLLGFYLWALEHRAKEVSILTTFFHDIGGVVNADIAFLPRSFSYAKYYDEKKFLT